MRCTKFILIYSTDTCSYQLDLYDDHLIDNPQSTYIIIGHERNEYISLTIHKESVVIENDCFGSCPIYVYRDNKTLALSSSLSELVRMFKTNIKGELLDVFVGFTYLPATDQTIFDNITIVKPSSVITVGRSVIFKEKHNGIFRTISAEVAKDELMYCFVASLLDKVKNLDTPALCLSSGHDSLLAGASLAHMGIKFPSITFGNADCEDIVVAKERHQVLFKNDNHHSVILNKSLGTCDELEEYSILTSGLGALSNICLYHFMQHAKSMNIKSLLFADHYETFRKRIGSVDNLVSSYTTPGQILYKYCTNIVRYNHAIGSTVKEMQSHYRDDVLYEFYLFDRVVKGHAHKNCIANSLNVNKVTLPFDPYLLRLNYNYIKQNDKFIFYDLLKDSCENPSNGIDYSNLPTCHNLPVDNVEFIKCHKEYFVDVLESYSSSQINRWWNVNMMANTLKHDRPLLNNEQWIIVRLLNLLIFANKMEIDIK